MQGLSAPLKTRQYGFRALIGTIMALSAMALRWTTDLRGLPDDVTLIATVTAATWIATWRFAAHIDMRWRAESEANVAAAQAELRRVTQLHAEHTRAIAATTTKGSAASRSSSKRSWTTSKATTTTPGQSFG